MFHSLAFDFSNKILLWLFRHVDVELWLPFFSADMRLDFFMIYFWFQMPIEKCLEKRWKNEFFEITIADLVGEITIAEAAALFILFQWSM